MANICDYIKWRGDLSFECDSFNEVDSLVLSQLSYFNFQDLIKTDLSSPMYFRDVVNTFLNLPDYNKRKYIGVFFDSQCDILLPLAGTSKRFGDLKVCGFRNVLNTEVEEQFSALTFIDEKTRSIFIAFRGTDDNLIGWKEDFNLAYQKELPAQFDAKNYVTEVAKKFKGNIYICGHSKGGNLSIYSAVEQIPKIQKRICGVYNNDGPGFTEDFFRRKEYLNVKQVIKTNLPEMSIIGMLFYHDDNYSTVISDAQGLVQHNPFSWHVEGNKFLKTSDVKTESKIISQTILDWFNEMYEDERKVFVETIFYVFNSTDAKTYTDIARNLPSFVFKVLKATANVDPKTKEKIKKIFQLLGKNALENIEENIDKIKNKED